MVANQFNLVAFANQANFVFSASIYGAWVSLLAAFKITLGERWGSGVLMLNLGSALTLVWLSLRFVGSRTRSALPVVFVAVCFATSLDFLHIATFVLSDTSYAALLAIFLFWLIGRKSQGISSLQFLFAVAFLLFMMIYRPVTPPLAAVFFLSAISLQWFSSPDSLYRRRMALAVTVLIILAGLVVISHTELLRNTSVEARGWMAQLAQEYRQGMVVFQRPETYRPEPTTFGDFLLISTLKAIYFWAPSLPGYSITHSVINMLNLVPAYALAGYAVFALCRNMNKCKTDIDWATWVLLLTLGAFTLFHALQQIDYDLRYRVPLYWVLYTLAGLGLYRIQQFRSRRNPPEIA